MGRQALVLGTLALSIAACGSRAPLDFELYDPSSDGGGVLADGAPIGPDGGPISPDGGPIGSDGGPTIPETGIPILDCGLCITSSCGPNVLGCISNTGCRDVLQCAMLNCLQGGLDTTCMFKCAANNPMGAIEAAQVLQCVTGKCGASCLGAFGGGGFGGGFGGNGQGGGGQGGGGGGRLPADDQELSVEVLQSRRDATCDILSRWPELACTKEQLNIAK